MRRVSVFIFTYSAYIAIVLFQTNTPAIQDRGPAGELFLTRPKIKDIAGFCRHNLKDMELSDKKGPNRDFRVIF
ncbi:MAG: hypothetical protein A2218_11395 [Elusimicrobia bacterium RIFOXYA2_FULL_53_38]|nr:MAG: hypothetical protein A2218_11395 [Elusimicrobia bacterium RIFOXYA2_FULL_53_38]